MTPPSGDRRQRGKGGSVDLKASGQHPSEPEDGIPTVAYASGSDIPQPTAFCPPALSADSSPKKAQHGADSDSEKEADWLPCNSSGGVQQSRQPSSAVPSFFARHRSSCR